MEVICVGKGGRGAAAATQKNAYCTKSNSACTDRANLNTFVGSGAFAELHQVSSGL